MNLPQLQFGVPLAGAILVLIAAVFAVAIDSPVAEGDGGPAMHRLFVPAAGCDSCEPQDVRLYYLGMRRDAAPFDDSRVRLSLWEISHPRLLAEGPDAVPANVGLAAGFITPDRASSVGTAPTGSVALCDNFLWRAGYPTLQDARRLVVTVEIANDDLVARHLAQTLNNQWLLCEAGLEIVEFPPDVLQARVEAGIAKVFITSIDASPSRPFELLPRLFATNSPENYTDVEPSNAAESVQPLLLQAANASPEEAEELYKQVSDRIASTYLNVLPLVWLYDINGQRPPRITLTTRPFLVLNQLNDTVTLDGTVSPGHPDAEIRQVIIDWGDGTRETVSLPASHRYAPVAQSTFKVIVVSARQSDGTVTWRTRWVGHYP